MKLLSPGETDLRTPDDNDNRVQIIFRRGMACKKGLIGWKFIECRGCVCLIAVMDAAPPLISPLNRRLSSDAGECLNQVIRIVIILIIRCQCRGNF